MGVPVNVIVAEVPLQTGELLETEAVGIAFTVTVTSSLMAVLHVFKTGDATPTSVYVLSEVKAGVAILADPEAFNVIDWFPPLPTLYVTTAFGVPLKMIVLD